MQVFHISNSEQNQRRESIRVLHNLTKLTEITWQNYKVVTRIETANEISTGSPFCQKASAGCHPDHDNAVIPMGCGNWCRRNTRQSSALSCR